MHTRTAPAPAHAQLNSHALCCAVMMCAARERDEYARRAREATERYTAADRSRAHLMEMLTKANAAGAMGAGVTGPVTVGVAGSAAADGKSAAPPSSPSPAPAGLPGALSGGDGGAAAVSAARAQWERERGDLHGKISELTGLLRKEMAHVSELSTIVNEEKSAREAARGEVHTYPHRHHTRCAQSSELWFGVLCCGPRASARVCSCVCVSRVQVTLTVQTKDRQIEHLREVQVESSSKVRNLEERCRMHESAKAATDVYAHCTATPLHRHTAALQHWTAHTCRH
jgi:hypothetical protein